MKRVINGITYSTETSIRLGEAKWDGNDAHTETLYQTKGGAFFINEVIAGEIWNEERRANIEQTSHIFRPVGPHQASDWLSSSHVKVFHNPFGEIDPAAAVAEPGATIAVRVPATLKRAVDEAAKQAGLSGNVWSMRCLERCVQDNELKTLLGSMAATLQFLEYQEHRLDSAERLRVGKAMMHLIDSAWKRRFPTLPSDEIGMHAEDQFDEYLEAAVQDNFSD